MSKDKVESKYHLKYFWESALLTLLKNILGWIVYVVYLLKAKNDLLSFFNCKSHLFRSSFRSENRDMLLANN